MAQVVDTTDDDDPAARHGSGVPPPINEKHRRPLRRRHGPAWASVHVLSENEEKGPYESRVRCRFCGEEFMADTARIEKHVKGADQKTVVVEPYRSPLDEDPASGDPEVVHPLPLCYEDATPTSPAERKEAIQWIEHHDLLLFYSQFGFAITEDLRRAIRTSEEATRSACLYPSAERSHTAALAASDAVVAVTEAVLADLQSTETLRRVGMGLDDADISKIVQLLKRCGALPHLRTLSFAENAIGDEGFSLICREILTPPQEEEGAPGGAQAQPTPLLDADDEPPEEDCPGLVGHLLDLSFFRNPIGDKGLAALAEALRLGALPKLECLNISGTAFHNRDLTPWLSSRQQRLRAAADAKHQHGHSHTRRHGHERSSPRRRSSASAAKAHDPAAAAAAGGGGADGTTEPLSDTVGDVGIKALAMAIKQNKPRPGNPGMLTSLRELRLFGNRIGDEGMVALADALGERPMLCRNLEELWLQSNLIGDRGLTYTVELLFNGSMVKLRRLLLSDNQIGNAGVAVLGKALNRGALGKLKKLSLQGNLIDDDAVDELHKSLHNRMYSLGGSLAVETDLLPSVAAPHVGGVLDPLAGLDFGGRDESSVSPTRGSSLRSRAASFSRVPSFGRSPRALTRTLSSTRQLSERKPTLQRSVSSLTERKPSFPRTLTRTLSFGRNVQEL